MRGRQHVLKPVGARLQIRARLFRGMTGVVIQDHANRAIRRIMGVQILEQRDELRAPVPLLDARGDVPVMQVQRCQNRPSAIANVLMITGHRGVFADHRGQVRRRVADGLHARLFIHRDRDHQRLGSPV